MRRCSRLWKLYKVLFWCKTLRKELNRVWIGGGDLFDALLFKKELPLANIGFSSIACGDFIVAIIIVAILVLWCDCQHIQIKSLFAFQSAYSA